MLNAATADAHIVLSPDYIRPVSPLVTVANVTGKSLTSYDLLHIVVHVGRVANKLRKSYRLSDHLDMSYVKVFWTSR